ncbi:MAG: DUF2255 family protein [Myxococcota bacterium]
MKLRALGFGVALLLSLGCASPPLATEPIDWDDADEAWSILVVTTEPDGGDRVTRIWLAMEGEEAVLRTGDSSWWANLQRNPRIRVRHDDIEYPFAFRQVTDADEKVRIDEVFLTKYGGWERMLFPQERGETHENYGRLLPVAAGSGY